MCLHPLPLRVYSNILDLLLYLSTVESSLLLIMNATAVFTHPRYGDRCLGGVDGFPSLCSSANVLQYEGFIVKSSTVELNFAVLHESLSIV